MAKTEADNLLKLEVWWLKKYGYFEGWKTGGIEWPKHQCAIGFEVKTVGKELYIRLRYSQTYSGQTKNFDYKVALTMTDCNFGGFRFWFRCPLSINERFCGRRVGVIYKLGNYFGCRHCHNLTYASKNLSGIFKIGGQTISLSEVEYYRSQVKRKIYGGKITKKMQRYQMKRYKSEMGMLSKMGAFETRFSKDDLTQEDFKDLK